MKNNKNFLKKIISHAKEYGFIFPSSEIYDGLSAIYDYGPNGIEVKNNLKNFWWKSMVQLNNNIVGIDSAIFMHPNTWEASGHLNAFNDFLIDNKESKKRYRLDILIEDFCIKIRKKINKEIKKIKKEIGENFNEKEIFSTNIKIIEYNKKINYINKRFEKSLINNDLNDIQQLIKELKISDPETGSRNWSEIKKFNLMFKTNFGANENTSTNVFLRPETAQGSFVNFLNVQKTGRMKIPFGIAQIGKSFRNEIIARQFIFRMREFEQMEMQFFISPEEEIKFYEFWKKKRLLWHLSLGLKAEKYRFHNHEKLAHYSNAACDIEFNFPFGFKEIEGIHSRTNFDLSSHEKHSGKKIQYFDSKKNKFYIPYVIETSLGLDRLFLAILANSLNEESLKNGKIRTVLNLPAPIAPYKAAILPIVKKHELNEFAYKIYLKLKLDYYLIYEEKDSIGKRYRRQDAIGTPLCITIDNTSLNDYCVTVRDRDSMKQERVSINKLSKIIDKKVNIKSLLINT